ncbi:phosphatidate cytidylyltransferase [Chloroherpeton thalassium ATCC 35110]|uniref:Phosphatidate cytidylyltransferase n=1 Tax=Chloroherpeton thalassium (strain ATCC 35110 / GB-78) TaxID=517418 RepID=B3QS93_CHLT3|nr:phosphatidate cytidylyltransferase [Chloroherpeton thalassium]ACF12484.1 phosphatidate cytidylyltransferase [Chloroherpeton thalassium ATCC 35110]
MSSNLAKRIIIALLGAPLVIWLIVLGGHFFFLLVIVIALASMNELRLMVKETNATTPDFLLFLASAGLLADFFYGFMPVSELAIAITIGFSAIELYRNRGIATHNLGASFLTVFYISLSFGTLFWLRHLDDHGLFVIITLLSVWAADTFAFFGGHALGQKIFKKKLFERISPKKTWEGYLMGVAGSIFISSLFNEMFPLPHATEIDAILIGAIIGVLSPIGDLIESMFKRDSGLKDSSEILPGHGGFFDRFDSLCFISPIIFFYCRYIIQI